MASKRPMQQWTDIKKTELEMMYDRGYSIDGELRSIYGTAVPPEDIRNAIADINVDMFMDWYHRERERRSQGTGRKPTLRAVMSAGYQSHPDAGPAKRTIVQYVSKGTGGTISKDTINAFITNASGDGTPGRRYDVGILVTDAKLGSDAKKQLKLFLVGARERWGFSYQMFFEVDLTYNPIHHVDVPFHERLSPDEVEQKFQEMRVDASKLLLIRKDDPVIRYYGWGVGDIIRIWRDDTGVSVLSLQSVNYRLIVN